MALVRYANMDYLCLSAISKVRPLKSVTMSYDIACQWGVNFATRTAASTTPTDLIPPDSLQIRYLVPKFHLEAHNSKCHAPHSFNLAVGVG
jgi:hypothetical protein